MCIRDRKQNMNKHYQKQSIKKEYAAARNAGSHKLWKSGADVFLSKDGETFNELKGCLLYTSPTMTCSITSSPADLIRARFAVLRGLGWARSIGTAKSRQSASTMPHSHRTL